MTQIVLMGLAAGAAAALLFASVASGSLLSIPLFYLAPLPILIVALGWNHLAAIFAALVGALALAVAFSAAFGLAFLVGVGLPAWWLGYLALLARTMADGAGGTAVEWFPIGRLVAWTAIAAALVVSAAVLAMAGDAESLRAALQRAFQDFLRSAGSGAPAADERPERWVLRALGERPELAVPATGAVLATLTLGFLLWLAGRIVRVSGRLRRPWPDLSALALPPRMVGVLGASIALTFVPDLIGVLGAVFAAAVTVAYGLHGLAIVHQRTRAMSGRGAVLTAVYAAIVVFGWPFALAALLGLADAFFPLRSRPGPGGPPALPS